MGELFQLRWERDRVPEIGPLPTFWPSVNMKVLVTQSCPVLRDSMDCSLASSSAHGILQARILEWLAIPFTKGSSQPRDRIGFQCSVSGTAGRFFIIWDTRRALTFYGWPQNHDAGGCTILYANILPWAYNEAQGLLEAESSAVLELVGSKQFSLCPVAMSFFQTSCPALFPAI